MKIFLLILTSLAATSSCYSQKSYDDRLEEIIDDIRELSYFDNGVIAYDDSSGYGLAYPYWTVSKNYYEDDIVLFRRGTAYRAVSDNTGKNPESSPEWRQIVAPHPYLFLRDSASKSDLVKLLDSDHPYVGVYAFGALAKRKTIDLFKVVVKKLADTTKMQQFTSDLGFTVYPADIMLWHSIEEFSEAQKDSLKELILTKYSYLITLEEILLFHKPEEKLYHHVKRIAESGRFGTAGLVALSRYRRREDLPLIRNGFKKDNYFSGFKVFFMAVRNFPHKSFRDEVLDYKIETNMNGDMGAYKYYFEALASYRNRKCRAVFDRLLGQPQDTSGFRSFEYRTCNTRMILQAMKKRHKQYYRHLIYRIENQILKGNENACYDYQLEESPWNHDRKEVGL